MTNDFYSCYECGEEPQQCHHVFNGADKQLSEDLGLMIPVCFTCHEKIHNSGRAIELKQEAQREYLVKVFGRCYL